jgi:hypothetical protein
MKAQKLNLLKKESLALMKRLWCGSGMEMQATAASALTLVARPVNPPPTLLHLTPPPPAHAHDDEGEESGEEEEDDNE